MTGSVRSACRFALAGALALTVCWDTSFVRPAQGEREAKTNPRQPYMKISGRVVDDETGKPVEHYTLEQGQYWGGKLGWGGSRTAGRWYDGKFDWEWSSSEGNKTLFRVLADGYLPELVTKEPLTMGVDKEVRNLEVRLRRGRRITGRVLDCTGAPEAWALIALVRDRPVSLVTGAADRMAAPSESPGSTATTDADGRFTIAGVDETARCLLVSALPAFSWTVPVPKTTDEMEIKLPAPGFLTIRYDIEGDDAEASVHVTLETKGMKGWEKIRCEHWVKAPNKGKVTVSALLPADYEVSRVKMPHLGHIGFGCSLDRGVVRVESGKTTEVDFARKTGVPIEGEVIGLRAGDGDEGAYIYVRPPEATGFNQDPDRSQWRLPVFDNVTCGLDGRFRTARISPGFYAVIAEAYETMPKQGPGMERVYRTGWELPKYVGVARVKVPESGKPVKVRIEMKPRDDRTPQPVKN